MRFEFKRSFDRSLKSLQSVARSEDLKRVIRKFIFSIENKEPFAHGFGLKKLKGNYYEIRSGLYDRIVFRRRDDLIEFVLVGDHNDIKRFLKLI